MGKARVLIVDDETRIVNTVKAYLENEGYETLLAYDGEMALDIWRSHQPDIVVLDIMMPRLDGLGFCREVRKRSPVPIIVLSARSAEDDKLESLGLGADDYMTKPFSPRELVARIRAVLRRFEPEESDTGGEITQGPLVIDIRRHRVTLLDCEVSLTATEFDFLAHMATDPGRVFSKDRLQFEVQGDCAEGYDSVVYSHIKNIRKKLSDVSSDWSFIETVHGAGYRFNATKNT
jgi:DNA-binding response OmpR family regulator